MALEFGPLMRKELRQAAQEDPHPGRHTERD